MQNSISQIAIIGTRIVTNEDEARDAAEFLLSWHGEGEDERDPLQVEACEQYDEDGEPTGKWEVREKWGANVKRDTSDLKTIATLDTEEEARFWADRDNTDALEDLIAGAEWHALPQPISFLWFPGCRRGQYPQSRCADLTASLTNSDGTEKTITVTGYGDAPYLREPHSHKALQDALEKLIAALV